MDTQSIINRKRNQVVVGVVAVVVLLAIAYFLYQYVSLKLSERRWKAMLEHEDFGTGLLSADLTVSQFPLIEKWAKERGYLYEPKADVNKEGIRRWSFDRSDGTQVRYSFIEDYYGYNHELAIQVQQGDTISLTDGEKFKPVALVAGIPQELQLTSPYQGVLKRWDIAAARNDNGYSDASNVLKQLGHSTERNKNAYLEAIHDGIPTFMYYAELPDKNIVLTVDCMGGVVSRTSLSIVQFRGARP